MFLVNISDVNTINKDALLLAGKASAKKAMADSQIDGVMIDRLAIVAAIEGVKEGAEEAANEVDDAAAGMYPNISILFHHHRDIKKTLSIML